MAALAAMRATAKRVEARREAVAAVDEALENPTVFIEANLDFPQVLLEEGDGTAPGVPFGLSERPPRLAFEQLDRRGVPRMFLSRRCESTSYVLIRNPGEPMLRA